MKKKRYEPPRIEHSYSIELRPLHATLAPAQLTQARLTRLLAVALEPPPKRRHIRSRP